MDQSLIQTERLHESYLAMRNLSTDMFLPERFDLTYIDENGEKKSPIMLHRALFGSIERFIGVIIEHFGGAFPTWLAPVQVKLIPVNNELHLDYARKIAGMMREADIRFEIDDREEKLGYKIREAQTKKIPYQIVVGDEEVKNNQLTIREYGSKDTTVEEVNDFLARLQREIKNMAK
jgi:threonyl-tRNA synthetase